MSTEPKIYNTEDFSYIRISELPESERPVFQRWLSGQTQPLVHGLEPPFDAAYSWDYARWKEQGMKLEQGLGWD